MRDFPTLIGIWIQLCEVRKPQLYAGIVVFATMGLYGMHQSAFEVFLLHAIGLMGFLMRRNGFTTAPVIVGMTLGPLAEVQRRRSPAISQGDAWVFLQRPLSGSILVLTALLAIGRWVWRKVRHRP